MSEPVQAEPWGREEFELRLRGLGVRYHIYHPFHQMMAEGQLDQRQIQGWVANRFYYQVSIPIKDANLLANCPDRQTRKLWVQRILDHDGYGDQTGGIEAWLRLGEAVGLDRKTLESQCLVLPGVRFAVDAYINFVRRADWHEGASSSLTELFAPEIHRQRLDNWPVHYPWVNEQGLTYFRKRLSEARRDVEHGLELTLDYFKTLEQQERALELLQFKLDILWSMLDAMYMAYVNNMPPYFNCEPIDA